MSLLIDTVEDYLNEIGWKYEKDEDADMIKTGVNADHASFRLVLFAIDDKDLLTLYVIQDNNIPENKRQQMAEFVARANWGLNIGNFDLDMDDGELLYKVAIDMEDGRLSTSMVGNMVGAGVSTMDRYYPGLMAVLFGNASPEEAIIQVERPDVTH